jgi:CRISPR-associated endoribonuclease Cas6
VRLKLHFNLKNPDIPSDYRPFLLSFLKHSVSNYDSALYQKLYENGTTPKKYTFAVWLDNPDFRDDTVLLKSNRMTMQFSTGDTVLGVHMYNSFLKMKNKEFPIPSGNSLLLREISLVPEKLIADNNIQIKFISPLVIRNRTNNKDYYYSVSHTEFHQELLKSVRYQLQLSEDLPVSLLDDFTLTPVQPQKSVILFYGQKMEVSLGTFEMRGSPVLMDYFYKNGISSRRGSGFGMIEV